MRLLVTGGCGFVGSNFVRYVLQHYGPEMVTNIDALSTGHLSNLNGVAEAYGDRYEFLPADLRDEEKVEALLRNHQYFAVLHFAAEAAGADATEGLLRRARLHGVRRFVLVSREGAGGTLPAAEAKALAAFQQHRQEVVVTRAPEIYGPYQPLTGLIPSIVVQALEKETVELPGDGLRVRDWLHVEDHCAALFAALLDGQPGAAYHFAAGHPLRDIDLAHRILDHLGRERHRLVWTGDEPSIPHRESAEAAGEPAPLAWKPRHASDAGLRSTIDWYVRHREWWESLVRR